MLIVDFSSVVFNSGKFHGGGDFSLRLIAYLRDRSIDFGIINNYSGFYEEFNVDLGKLEVNRGLIYFNPLYRGEKISNPELYIEKVFYIHGLRMLEMPYDEYAYKYAYGLKNKLLSLIKYYFFKSYYYRKEVEFIARLLQDYNGVRFMVPSLHSSYILRSLFSLKNYPVCLTPFLSQPQVGVSPISSSDKYILMLGGDRWVKNSYRFIRAFKELKSNGHLVGVDLKVIGVAPFANVKQDLLIGLHWLDYVEESELHNLLSRCVFLAYPSLNEGFGYPVIDALGYGKPVLCGSKSALNEVYNGEVVFADPTSIVELKSRILYVLDCHVDSEEMAKRRINFSLEKRRNIEHEWHNYFKKLIVRSF